MQVINYVILILIFTFSAPSMAKDKMFGKDFTESCIHGAIDAQLKNGLEAAKPARASAMCLCLGDELNKSVLKEDMDLALKGDTEKFDAKQQKAMQACLITPKSNIVNQRKSENLQPASNWVRVGGNTEGGFSDYINRDSIRKDETGLVRLWARREYSKLQKLPDGSIYANDEFSIAANCQDFTVAVTAGIMYDKKNILVQKYELKRSQWIFHEATPDSLQGVIIKNHCS